MAGAKAPTARLTTALRDFEGLQLTAYRCPSGVWTIGYGHTGKEARPGRRISERRAEELLQADIQAAWNGVCRHYTPRSGAEADALTDFVFNLGVGKFRASTLLKKLNAPKRDAAAIRQEFMRWVYSGKQVLPGLVKRRQWEAKRFFEGE